MIEVGFKFGSGEFGHRGAVVGIGWLLLSDPFSYFKICLKGVSDISIILEYVWP